ncbi:FXYD domain containing ion transport regulator 7 isoform X2 [Cynoglossus semilaevis]|uniref:FXYD domain-containing ion transport regulator n=1 Tax=Cynoglossus semilaevis TaxID=244447 RepID=A0A3P8V8Q8_CYNSE|nr:uncharacterized protein LOC103388498 isoform X2 [Cynoglossus semilaevis]
MCPYEKCSTRSLVCTIVVAFYSAVATRGLPVKRFGEQSSLLFIARLYLQPSNPPNFTETSSNLCCAAMATTETMFTDRSDFDYDYETLRTTGLVLAIIMFVSGILIALSKKFTNCVKSSSNSNPSGSEIPKTEVPAQTV